VLQFDDNDPAIVRLRAHPEMLDLHGVETTLRGGIGFPMTARGQLLGVIVLGDRRSGERYAPDEISAISQLATGLGAALDIFKARDGKDGAVERLVASVDALREELVRRFPTITI
jgi:GAF domain-containing protein